MPEINDQQVLEQTRTEVADENDESRLKYHHEDQIQVADIALSLKKHCDKQLIRDELLDERDAKTEKKLDKLMPLVELAPLIKAMVDERRAYTIVAAKIIKWVGVIGAIIALIGGALSIIKYWRN